jgi:hypothetical protein
VCAGDDVFGRALPRLVVLGYHLWARPFTRLMRRSRVAFAIGQLLGVGWANEMAARMDITEARPNLVVGKLCWWALRPLCGLLGRASVACRGRRWRTA